MAFMDIDLVFRNIIIEYHTFSERNEIGEFVKILSEIKAQYEIFTESFYTYIYIPYDKLSNSQYKRIMEETDERCYMPAE